MLKFKKILSTALALALSASCLPMAVMAEGEETIGVEPEILFYRDYEDYAGGNDGGTGANTPSNARGAFGTYKFAFDGTYVPNSFDNARAVEGKTGKGFVLNQTQAGINAGAVTYHQNLPASVKGATSGKLYATFTSEALADTTRAGKTGFRGTDGRKYLAFQHGVGYGVSGWATDRVNQTLQQENLDYYEVGMVLDIATGVQDTYINGEKVKSAKWNENINYANSYFDILIENGVIIDNFAIVYYPADILTQTFSMKENGVDVENDKISVILTSNAVDSDGANGSALSAPYGVILPEVDAETFAVEGLTVTAVEKGTLPGEYVITVAEDLVDNANYKVTPAIGLTDIFGAVTDGNSVNAINPTEAEVFYYRDFEEYTDGNPWSEEAANNYGKMRLFGDSSYNNSFVYETATGTGVKLDTNGTNPKITEGSKFGTLSDGTLYIAYEEISGGSREDIYFNRTADGNVGSTIWCWNGTKWASGTNNWSVDTTTGLEAGHDAKYKIELVVDLEDSTVDRYINGVCVKKNRTLKAKEFKELTFAFSTGSIIDNMSVIYFPEKLVSMPTFSVNAGTVDAEANQVSVFLNSDTVDSDALNGSSAMAAPYGVSLATVDATSFTVDGYTVSAVAKGDAVGEYVITLAEDVQDGASLTVTAADSLTDILGSVVNAEAKAVVVGAPKYEVSVATIDGANASVTYTNTTDNAERFVLAVASYVDKRLSEIQFKTVTAGKNIINKEVTVALKNSVEGKTVKAFVLSDFTKLTPLK